MFNLRIYRIAFIPALFALVIAAFSFQDQPKPATTHLAADAFDGGHAFGAEFGIPRESSLKELAATFPRRSPGSHGDDGLAERAEKVFAANGLGVRSDIARTRTSKGAIDLKTVVGTRAGLSPRRIAVVAFRDARSAPAEAQLSATAALFELARVFKLRNLKKTLVFVSASGNEGGASAQTVARLIGDRESTDAVLVLGDLASTTKGRSWVTSWSNGTFQAPLGLRRTVETAVDYEAGVSQVDASPAGQWIRSAAPLTFSAQGELARRGLPALLLQVSGERGPSPSAVVSRAQFVKAGRASVRAITALDQKAGTQIVATGGWDGNAATGVAVGNKLFPEWSVRLLVAALLLPALLICLDGFIRACGRGDRTPLLDASLRKTRTPRVGVLWSSLEVVAWLSWPLLACVPIASAFVWLRLVGLVGGFGTAPSLVLPSPKGLGVLAVAIFASIFLVWWIGWYVLRLLLKRPVVCAPASGGRAVTAIGLVMIGTVFLVWIANPYAAALVVPAVHLWLFAGASRSGSTKASAIALFLGLLPLGAIPLYYCLAFHVDPLTLLWSLVVAMAEGFGSVAVLLPLLVLSGCFVAMVLVVRGKAREDLPMRPSSIRTRGPLSYAGPGSLGGSD